jgi:ribosomal protein S18 acetylase RimI-like enzyme
MIARVHVAAWRAAYAGLMPQGVLDALDAELRAASWARSLSMPGTGITAVATDETRVIVGFCVYGPSRDQDAMDRNTGELFVINVLPQVWRNGLGRQLCQLAAIHGHREGWQAISLWVLRENKAARAFYEAMGFAADGAEKTDTSLIDAPLNEVRYSKQLADCTQP